MCDSLWLSCLDFPLWKYQGGGGIACFREGAKPAEKVSRDMGYRHRNDSTLRLLNALNSEDRGLKVRFSLATIVFETFELILCQMLSSQGKNAPSDPYPHYLVRLAASRYFNIVRYGGSKPHSYLWVSARPEPPHGCSLLKGAARLSELLPPPTEET